MGLLVRVLLKHIDGLNKIGAKKNVRAFRIKWQRGHKLRNQGQTPDRILSGPLSPQTEVDYTFEVGCTLMPSRTRGREYMKKKLKLSLEIEGHKRKWSRVGHAVVDVVDVYANATPTQLTFPVSLKSDNTLKLHLMMQFQQTPDSYSSNAYFSDNDTTSEGQSDSNVERVASWQSGTETGAGGVGAVAHTGQHSDRGRGAGGGGGGGGGISSGGLPMHSTAMTIPNNNTPNSHSHRSMENNPTTTTTTTTTSDRERSFFGGVFHNIASALNPSKKPVLIVEVVLIKAHGAGLLDLQGRYPDSSYRLSFNRSSKKLPEFTVASHIHDGELKFNHTAKFQVRDEDSGAGTRYAKTPLVVSLVRRESQEPIGTVTIDLSKCKQAQPRLWERPLSNEYTDITLQIQTCLKASGHIPSLSDTEASDTDEQPTTTQQSPPHDPEELNPPQPPPLPLTTPATSSSLHNPPPIPPMASSWCQDPLVGYIDSDEEIFTSCRTMNDPRGKGKGRMLGLDEEWTPLSAPHLLPHQKYYNPNLPPTTTTRGSTSITPTPQTSSSVTSGTTNYHHTHPPAAATYTNTNTSGATTTTSGSSSSPPPPIHTGPPTSTTYSSITTPRDANTSPSYPIPSLEDGFIPEEGHSLQSDHTMRAMTTVLGGGIDDDLTHSPPTTITSMHNMNHSPTTTPLDLFSGGGGIPTTTTMTTTNVGGRLAEYHQRTHSEDPDDPFLCTLNKHHSRQVSGDSDGSFTFTHRLQHPHTHTPILTSTPAYSSRHGGGGGHNSSNGGDWQYDDSTTEVDSISTLRSTNLHHQQQQQQQQPPPQHRVSKKSHHQHHHGHGQTHTRSMTPNTINTMNAMKHVAQSVTPTQATWDPLSPKRQLRTAQLPPRVSTTNPSITNNSTVPILTTHTTTPTEPRTTTPRQHNQQQQQQAMTVNKASRTGRTSTSSRHAHSTHAAATAVYHNQGLLKRGAF